MATLETGSQLLTQHLAGPPKRSQSEIAVRCDVTQQTVSRWKSGEDAPEDLETQLLLEEATDGAVPVESWLSAEAAAALDAKIARRISAARADRRSRAPIARAS